MMLSTCSSDLRIYDGSRFRCIKLFIQAVPGLNVRKGLRREP